MKTKRIVVTGHSGLVGHHVKAALLAENALRRYVGEEAIFQVVLVDRSDFADSEFLPSLLDRADAVIHLAAVNRPAAGESYEINLELAKILTGALDTAGCCPFVAYANSTKSIEPETDYGFAKRNVANHFEAWCSRNDAGFADFILPHVFGEAGRPYHNGVTATLCADAVAERSSTIHPGAVVSLIHASAVADRLVTACVEGLGGRFELEGKLVGVQELAERIVGLRRGYLANLLPDLSSHFERDLFNTYRWFEPIDRFPELLEIHADQRGSLFEAVKGGGGGQTFLSWTLPGVTRGEHFHRRKIERFVVLQGEAVVRLRSVFDGRISEHVVSGERPAIIDIPTFHAHNIKNVGSSKLLTLFWAHEIFDPKNADTFMEFVGDGE